MVDFALTALERLEQEKYILATRMMLTVLHNLYLEPKKERFRHLRTSNPVRMAGEQEQLWLVGERQRRGTTASGTMAVMSQVKHVNGLYMRNTAEKEIP